MAEGGGRRGFGNENDERDKRWARLVEGGWRMLGDGEVESLKQSRVERCSFLRFFWREGEGLG